MENNGENKENTKSGGRRAGDNPKAGADSIFNEVVSKIQDADSVLVALSNDPSVDEIAAAMGLSMALDAIGKHVTAIYSGKTPNVLEFLKPRDRFEKGTESLQDFVIALNKDKADHLRYKIDGDFVKVYVTPYKTTISGDDLEFSRGDYNVDLVVALNVPAANELDAALKEHGRIMHDATSINISNSTEGNFGDVEWVDSDASSISEMVSKLAFELNPKIDSGTATALLTGLVAATDRFKNSATTPDVMVLAAKLMGAGADQQLVVKNVQGEVVFNGDDDDGRRAAGDAEDATQLEINHDEGGNTEESEGEGNDEDQENADNQENLDNQERESNNSVPEDDSEQKSALLVLDEPSDSSEAVREAMAEAMEPSEADKAPKNSGTVAGVDVAVVPDNADGYEGEVLADQIVNDIEKGDSNVGSADYGKMIDEALNESIPGVDDNQVGNNESGLNARASDSVESPDGDTPVAEDNNMSVDSNEQVVDSTGIADDSANVATDGGDINASSYDTQAVDNSEEPNEDMASREDGGDANDVADMPVIDGEGNSEGSGMESGTDVQMTNGNDMKVEPNVQMEQGTETNGSSDASMTMVPTPNSEMNEEDATGMTEQGQEDAGMNIANNGEVPSVITGNGMDMNGETTDVGVLTSGVDANPAMVNAPEVETMEASGVPDMNYVGMDGTEANNSGPVNTMPLPGQEMAPPPMAPMPDFGTMPPAEETAQIPGTPQMPEVMVQPDINVQTNESMGNDANALPQMPQVDGTGNIDNLQMPGQMNESTNDGDPSAFKIPGIHT